MLRPRRYRPIFVSLLFLLLVGSVLTSILCNIYFQDVLLVNVALHSSIEAFSGLSAIVMAILLLHLHRDGARERGEYYLLSMGFFMMGILDTCHAVSTFGHGFILLRSLANFSSGLWSVLVWFPKVGGCISKGRFMTWLVPSTTVCVGLLILTSREFWPEMLSGGQFTRIAILINLISGIFLTASAFYFFLEFSRTSKTESYLFSYMFVLLGVSACELFLSRVWSDGWWLWSLERFVAYLVVFYYIFRTFLRVREELRHLNEFLEQKIAERTAELSKEVAERKRYGKERDKVVAELQDALARIRMLTGLLPTCASCKRIRDRKGNWVQMEHYIQIHSEAKFSHGICPDCVKKLYPDLYPDIT